MNRRSTIILSIIFGGVLLGIWIYLVDIKEMLNIVKEFKISLIIPLGAIFTLVYFIRSLRWRIILSPISQITVFESFKLCMTNYFINFLIPIHAGEIAKSLLLKKIDGTPVSKSILTVYLDKITDMLPIFLLMVVAPFVDPQISSIIYLISGALFIILLVCILFYFSVALKKNVALSLIDKIFFFFPEHIKSKLRSFVSVITEAATSLPQLSKRLFEIVSLTILALIFHCALMWLFFYSFGIKMPLVNVFVGYLLLNASFLLPAPPGFSGSLELTFLFIFSFLLGYDKNIVSVVAAGSHLLLALLFGFWGILSIVLLGTRLTAVFKMGSGE
ncbi:lysylphosphatidylglycerol synthase transmembrane domain-containing protein [Acidobacteriota bacterium]